MSMTVLAVRYHICANEYILWGSIYDFIRYGRLVQHFLSFVVMNELIHKLVLGVLLYNNKTAFLSRLDKDIKCKIIAMNFKKITKTVDKSTTFLAIHVPHMQCNTGT